MPDAAVPFAPPRVLAWELTRRCPMKCRHCRAMAADAAFGGELSTDECRLVIDSLVRLPTAPMVIWTGGEPMSREDLVELVRHATSKGIRSVLAPCGKLVTESRLKELKEAGVMACSFSLDGADAATHNAFRGIPDAYQTAVDAMRIARNVGMPFQINCTVSKLNVTQLDKVLQKAKEFGARKLDLFFLVPVGRGKSIAEFALSDAETVSALEWMRTHEDVMPMKATCCPSGPTGCLGGRSFAFLSHNGNLQTCGFIDKPCGNIRDFNFDFPAMIAAAVNPLGSTGNCRGWQSR